MARSIEEIQDEILTARANEPALQELNSSSKTSIWRLWIYITAFAIWVLEKLFDAHKAEVSEALRQLKPHTARWYRNKALAFQYGFDLLEDSDQFDNEGHDPEQIEESKIIKYSAVTESEIESRLIVKIATEQGEELQPISPEQKESFEAYLSEIKDAGVKITVINYLPDILRLQMKIYRDPLVLDQNGNKIKDGTQKPVETAIKNYLKKLPFNGELVLAHLVDELQKVEGVKIPHITLAESKWIDADVNDYGNFQPIDVKTIPISGYFKIENFSGIEYVV
ncbi:nucleotidyltransferase [Riemerella anatipestifer]|uniref:nucleotidyltransferase n=1 Tax=Riemerella anatipestifer TaxID=34085 RepID=UPI0013730F25|nr:nucleotidyltransferase [Riemerella anatipestifer]MBT0550255.1 nucleotidyltransferase [Riemerella anatipestifer]MBT0556979.1 nucleotidyltransferase [Riemerella anatipestifer]MBT0561015.1 nucleotidyltransferase [Riemerella anatipestifer]NAV17314.1 nucleotidyltransferase [Riemerella anatipestifer]